MQQSVCKYIYWYAKKKKWKLIFQKWYLWNLLHQICFYLRKFCQRKNHDLCMLFGHLIRLLWLWSLALIYLTAGILNTNVCGYHSLTYLFNVYKLKKKKVSVVMFLTSFRKLMGFSAFFSYRYKGWKWIHHSCLWLFHELTNVRKTFEARICKTIELSHIDMEVSSRNTGSAVLQVYFVNKLSVHVK